MPFAFSFNKNFINFIFVLVGALGGIVLLTFVSIILSLLSLRFSANKRNSLFKGITESIRLFLLRVLLTTENCHLNPDRNGFKIFPIFVIL